MSISISEKTLTEFKHNYFASVMTVVSMEFFKSGLDYASKILMFYVIIYVFAKLVFSKMFTKNGGVN